MEKIIVEIFFLSAAVSIDAFIASFAYGMRRIKIPFLSVFILTGISVLFLTAALYAGSLLSFLLPAGLTNQISFLILFVLGLVKLFDRSADTQADKADKNHDNLLSPPEALYLGLALSVDSLAAGLGAGMLSVPSVSYLLLALCVSFSIGIFSIFSGSFLGKTLSARLNGNFCRISGLILITLAFMKFF